MIPKRNLSISGSSNKSWILVFVFVVITVIGFSLMFSSMQRFSSTPDTDNQSQTEQENQTYKSSYSNFIVKTVLITAMLIVVLIIGSRWYRSKTRSDVLSRLKMDVVGRKYIGPKHYLLLVNVEGRGLLLGVTDNSINLLSEYSEEELQAKIEDSFANKEEGTFQNVFKRFKSHD